MTSLEDSQDAPECAVELFHGKAYVKEVWSLEQGAPTDRGNLLEITLAIPQEHEHNRNKEDQMPGKQWRPKANAKSVN